MISRFLHILGLSDHVTDAGQLSFHWQRPMWLLAGLLVLIPIAWFIVRRHRARMGELSMWSRWALTTCRVGILLLLVVILGGPFVRGEDGNSRLPVLIVLIDESASMALPADVGVKEGNEGGSQVTGATRLETVEAALVRHQESLFAGLSQRFDLQVHRFARFPRRVDPATRIAPLEESQRDDTALGEALVRATEAAGQRPVAAIMLFSDGGWTTGRNPMSVMTPRGGIHDSIAPIYAVPAGPHAPVADVALSDVVWPRAVARGDVAVIHASVRATGLVPHVSQVRLLDGDRELDRTSVTLRDGQPQQVQLQFRDTMVAGRRSLRVRADAHEAEIVQQNNSKDIYLKIDDQRIRVLYIESVPRWDFRFLDHALRRDKGIEITTIMESQVRATGVTKADLPAAAGLPGNAAQYGEFSLVMLGDVSPALLTPANQEQLAMAVRKMGVGLVVHAGTQSMPHRYIDDPLGDLLPVALKRQLLHLEDMDGEGTENGGLEAQAFAPFRMNVTAAGAVHPAFTLDAHAERNRHTWNRMPEFHWAAAAAEARPAATVLAEVTIDQRSVPLIAEHRAGRGRVFYVGTDSTYLWRRQVGDQYFQQFWGQAIRHVAKPARQLGQTNSLAAYPQVVQPGEAVEIELNALDARGQPVKENSIVVEVRETSAYAVPGAIIIRREVTSQIHRGTWTAPALGEYTFRCLAPGAGHSVVVRVGASGEEYRNPSVDRGLLESLAQRSGGRMVELEDIGKLASMLPIARAQNHHAYEENLWDNWLMVLLLSVVYCIDVGVRRWHGLA